MNVHRFPDRDAWLRQRVFNVYVGRRPVMGAPDDDDDGHAAAAASAKLNIIRELVLEERKLLIEYGERLPLIYDDILVVLDA